MNKNRRIVLASRPQGEARVDNFRLETVPLPALGAVLAPGSADGARAEETAGCAPAVAASAARVKPAPAAADGRCETKRRRESGVMRREVVIF